MFDSILLVCTANICRSPIAEALFRHHFPNKRIFSAGTKVEALNLIDVPADKGSIQATKWNGLDISDHRATQVTSELLENSDLILVMDETQKECVSRYSSGVRSKTLLIGQWINIGEVADPYGKSDEAFNACFRCLEQAVISWKKRIPS
ncbi:low molecular weight protein-tyrosine-phosphatase [Vibrio bivalvicida]|uniref:protein-tyrosine-phosphatase n=1 Tax=Vibrio bivalvicida TaxID=1276888 RepID=A0ABV4MMG2_9VIBR